MADARAVRASSRRITPTPQPLSALKTPQPVRATRRRGTRSTSREVEQPLRRSVRQASVTSDRDVQEAGRKRKTVRHAGNDTILSARELSPVEETDTQFALWNAPQSTPRRPRHWPESYHSPQSTTELDATEITGTTAIASPSIVEAESLNAKFVRKTLPRLYRTSEAVLSHLVPDEAMPEDDTRRIEERWNPESDFTEEYNDLNDEFELKLKKFKTSQQQYVRPRAIHRTLNPDGDPNEPLRGIDAVVYLANLANLTKHLMGSQRGTRKVGNALRELEQQFPQIALSSFDPSAGGSSLLKATFELALEIRTQHAIFTVENVADDDTASCEAIFERIFYRPTESGGTPSVKGWSMVGLQDEDLSSEHRRRIEDDLSKMKQHLPDAELLGVIFPWGALLLQVMAWVRLRRKELRDEIEALGGIDALSDMLINNILPAPITKPTASPEKSPRKSRTSFTQDRRRRSGKHDDLTKDAIADAVIAKEDTTLRQESELPRKGVEEVVEPTVVEPAVEEAVVKAQPAPVASEAEAPVAQVPEAEERPSVEDKGPFPGNEDGEPEAQKDTALQSRPNAAQGPPQTSADLVKLVKQRERVEKENQRNQGYFARQQGATRVGFGNGFDDSPASPAPSRSDATAGPSRRQVQPSLKRKRGGPELLNESDSDEEFESRHDSQMARERRRIAPVAKRVRIEPPPSAPTSHQPRAQSPSSPEPGQRPASTAPAQDVAASAAVTSTAGAEFREVQQVAQLNRRAVQGKTRKPRTPWTPAETERFRELMAEFPRQYSRILQEDKGMEAPALQERDQVALKDKARTMARTMIESATGLEPGFEQVITSNSALGRKLVADGFDLYEE